MTKATNNRPNRTRTLVWVDANKLQVNPVAQREFRPTWAATILAQWDLEKFQEPHVNRRADGSLYVMEGQHGTHAYREKYAEEGQECPIQVWLYEGLTEQEEAEFFLSLNNKKSVGLMDKFLVAVVAGREEEVAIDRIVRSKGCRISPSTAKPGAIAAVGAVQSIFRRYGGHVLGDTIEALKAGLGDHALEQYNLMGVALVLTRYGVQPANIAKALLSVRGGSKGLTQAAYLIREQFGCDRRDASAAAVVQAYNKVHRGKNALPSWFAVKDAA